MADTSRSAPPPGASAAPGLWTHLLGEPGPHRWRLWLTWLGLWFIPVVVLAAQRYIMYSSWEIPISFFEEFSFEFFHCYVYAALSLVVPRLGRRFPIDRGRLVPSLLPHIGLTLAFVAVRSVIMTLLILMMGGYIEAPMELGVVWRIYTLKHCTLDAIMYWLILGVSQFREAQRWKREQELRTSQLETQLAQAQLSALKMQLHPHFLFNTLNAIAALTRAGETRGAVKMIVGLADLLRLALDSQRAQTVPLEQELGFLDKYLSIEQVRFPDRLRVVRNIDPASMKASVPNLILQPLVENAICHGLAPRAEPGTVEIHARVVRDRLELEVCDDGLGFPKGWSVDQSRGVGLTNTRARLAQLYGAAQSFEIAERPGGGVRVLLTLPLHFDGGTEVWR